MTIDGDYIICNAEEAERYLIQRRPGDQLRTVSFNNNTATPWSACEPHSGVNPGDYHPIETCQIRRLISQCTPEILKLAGYAPEHHHFL